MEASYQAFVSETDDSEDAAHTSSVKVHVPPSSKVSRWSHIEDLDSFFSRIYTYHQKHGFSCIVLTGCFELLKVIFILLFCIFLLYFVDYNALFTKRAILVNGTTIFEKRTLSEAICPFDECFSHISMSAWICIYIVVIYWIFRLIKLLYNLYHFYDIKQFFNIALEISDDQLDNVTWLEVERKICEVQREQQMCIRKTNLTELDIYHRILRSKNYFVAMVNKSLLPIHYDLPFFGSVTYFSQGLKYNIELLLFSPTWGLFENWHLKEEYKKSNKRHELASKLKSKILWFALVNLIFGVFIFFWQIVYFFCNYAEVIKREPGFLGIRCWSLYSRLYLRHFNELDHELDERLRRAYKPASRYTGTFSSPIMNIIAQNIVFIAGTIFAVLAVLSVYDEEVLSVEHVFFILTMCGIIVTAFRSFIPDENIYWCQESLMIEILAEVHYLPDSWRGQAHTKEVRDQFTQLFQYKATHLFHELISPIATPLIMIFKLRPRSLEMIDFYRNYTVSVLGVGDVCSFSLMDMRKHGNAAWHTTAVGVLNNKKTQAEDGKTELSLIHFAAKNPTWTPPEKMQQRFIQHITESARNIETDVLHRSTDKHIQALESTAAGLNMFTSLYPLRKSGRMEASAFRSSMYSRDSKPEQGVCRRMRMSDQASTLDTSISALYLHNLHHRGRLHNPNDEELLSSRPYSLNSSDRASSSGGRNWVYEGTPLLHQK